jgi:hypothetical protein
MGMHVLNGIFYNKKMIIIFIFAESLVVVCSIVLSESVSPVDRPRTIFKVINQALFTTAVIENRRLSIGDNVL